ncbi:hypothetical protein CBM2587_B90314 [Cupriavidus taiwanensis]|uniref:Uncharacterized protein n=1 Tax=Cupriavidus taiwanensis TaxID=164546 RepID=A0A375CCN4_9BURK|nr:hypothetical protein CBM2587_B90314 [Cupriavidus taiwanensis]
MNGRSSIKAWTSVTLPLVGLEWGTFVSVGMGPWERLRVSGEPLF